MTTEDIDAPCNECEYSAYSPFAQPCADCGFDCHNFKPKQMNVELSLMTMDSNSKK